MDFALSEQQQLIRTEVRNLARQFAWSYWRELDRTSAYPHEFFNAFAAAGWLGTVIPTAYGGSGLGVTEACIVLGEIAASGAGTSGASPVHFSMFPPMPIELFLNKKSGRLSSKNHRGAHRWGCSSETTVR